jgi:hypothetical protein
VSGLLLAVAVVLAAAVSAWFLVAVPFALVAMYGAWLGLSSKETWDAMDTWDDPGGGPAGMSP